VSVTDRCNLRCVYCMPAEGIEKRPSSEILSYEELSVVIRAASELGISKVRAVGLNVPPCSYTPERSHSRCGTSTLHPGQHPFDKSP